MARRPYTRLFNGEKIYIHDIIQFEMMYSTFGGLSSFSMLSVRYISDFYRYDKRPIFTATVLFKDRAACVHHYHRLRKRVRIETGMKI